MKIRSIAWGRILYAIFSLTVAGFGTYFFSHYLDNSGEKLGIIAAIFSILAGVLIAVISILGDPSMLMDQSWRRNFHYSKEIQRKLHRKTDIFLLYVLILATLFAFSLVENNTSDFYRPLQISVFFLSVLGFLASASLPFSLVRIQKDRLDNAIKSMKGKSNNSG